MAGLSAGVAVADSSVEAFNLVKTKKKDFVLFEINAAGTEVVPVAGGLFPESAEDVAAYESDVKEKKQEQNFATRVYPKFKSALVGRGKNPCYAVVDLRYIAEERAQDKLVFIFWCPDNVGVRQKMVGASTYTAFSAKLGVACKIQAQDASDLELAALVAKK
jgi:hypothetical protein